MELILCSSRAWISQAFSFQLTAEVDAWAHELGLVRTGVSCSCSVVHVLEKYAIDILDADC